MGFFSRPRTLVEGTAAARAAIGLDGPGELTTRSLEQVIDGMIAAQGASVPGDIRALPAVAAAVRLIGSTVAQLPVGVSRGQTPEWLARPRVYGGQLDLNDLLGFLVDSMTLHGRGYLLATCTAEGDAPSFRLDALDPDYVQVVHKADGIVGRSFLWAGQPLPEVPAMLGTVRKGGRYLVHVPFRVTVDHPEGSTPLTEAAATLRGHLAVERHTSLLFDGGTYVGGVLSTTSDITPAQAEVWQAAWIQARKSGKVAVLGNGLEYRNELADGNELQMVETRSFNQSVVWALLGIPQAYMGSSLMGGQSSLSYSNAQDNRRQFADNCLRGYTQQIEDSLSRLLPNGRNPAENIRLEFDYDEWEGRGVDGDQATAVGSDPAGI